MIYKSWDMEHDRLKLAILGHFLPFYHLKNPKNQNFEKMKIFSGHIICTKNHKQDVQFLRYRVRRTGFFFHSWTIFSLKHFGHFLHLHHPDNPENQNFEKIKKGNWRYYHLHMSTISDNHRMYGSWDMEYDQYIFLPFWAIFCPFTLLTTQKIKILKNWKKTHTHTHRHKGTRRYHNFTHMYQKLWSHDVCFLRYGA